MYRSAIAAAGVLGIVTGSLLACAVAPPPNTTVRVAQESAIIVWDSGSKIQHFIRRATFKSAGPDFGFLVPTPTQPTLSEASDAVFASLEKLIAPKIITTRRYIFLPFRKGAAKSAAPGVTVLEERRVAGYDAAVLAADNAAALNNWLTKHGYATRPDLTAWLEPYVKENWILTAFKIAREAGSVDVATSAVQMSFAAPKPFFPYSEPADQREPGEHAERLLRIFLLADGRYEGWRGANREWHGTTVYSAPLANDAVREYSDKLALAAVAPGMWLNAFEDIASPRPGTEDLFFQRAQSQTPLLPKPLHHTEVINLSGFVCLGVTFLCLAAPILISRLLSRRSKAA